MTLAPACATSAKIIVSVAETAEKDAPSACALAKPIRTPTAVTERNAGRVAIK